MPFGGGGASASFDAPALDGELAKGALEVAVAADEAIVVVPLAVVAGIAVLIVALGAAIDDWMPRAASLPQAMRSLAR